MIDPDLQKQKVILEIEEKELEAKEFVQSYSKFQRYALIIILILIIPIFFGAKYLTAALYFNNFKKAAAISAHPATLVTLPVSIIESKILPVSGNGYSAYALIKNQNKNLVTPELTYTFNFYDASGAQIGSSQGTDFLLPGQQKYLIVPNIILNSIPAQLKVVIADPVWQNRIQSPSVPITNGVPTYSDQADPPGFAINSSFRNDSNYTLATVVVKGIVFDNSNSVIAVTSHIENTVSPEQTRDFHLYWPRFLQASVGKVEVDVETNPFDPSNLQ